MIKRLATYLCFSLIGLAGCNQAPPSDPACRVKEPENPQKIANAVCVIRLDGRLLSVTHRLSGKFDLPGGTSNGTESAQCTAHRETWEETGFNVEVGQWLGENEKGTRYYACTLTGGFDGSLEEFPIPPWSQTEISSIQLIDPFAISDKQWRFQDRLVQLRDMYNQVEDSKPVTTTPQAKTFND